MKRLIVAFVDCYDSTGVRGWHVAKYTCWAGSD